MNFSGLDTTLRSGPYVIEI